MRSTITLSCTVSHKYTNIIKQCARYEINRKLAPVAGNLYKGSLIYLFIVSSVHCVINELDCSSLSTEL
jgi:hypothetical protein